MEALEIVDCRAGATETAMGTTARAAEITCSLLTWDQSRLSILFKALKYLQSFLLCDVEGGGHVDESGKAVQMVTVGMRKDGVCLKKRKEKKIQIMVYKKSAVFAFICMEQVAKCELQDSQMIRKWVHCGYRKYLECLSIFI